MNAQAFCEMVCRRASNAGIGLRLEPTSHGFTWAWGINGMVMCSGGTDAHTKPVALFFACQDVHNLIPHAP